LHRLLWWCFFFWDLDFWVAFIWLGWLCCFLCWGNFWRGCWRG
jgi:hypothetical protein